MTKVKLKKEKNHWGCCDEYGHQCYFYHKGPDHGVECMGKYKCEGFVYIEIKREKQCQNA